MVWTEPLYGDVTIEVADNTDVTPTWVNLSADLLNATANRGGDAAIAGESETQVGQMTAMFNNLSTVPLVGWWVRVRIQGSNIWAGFVNDVATVTVFDENEPGRSYEVTTLSCSDWVALTANVTKEGSLVYPMTSVYGINMTAAAAIDGMNDAISTGFDLIAYDSGFSSNSVAQTDMTATVAEHLDAVCASFPDGGRRYWYSAKTSATTNHAPAGGIQAVAETGSNPSPLTFTDGATGLHYTDIVVESTAKNVSNIITTDNRSMIRASNNPKLRVFADEVWTASDATSVGLYGERRAAVQTRVPLTFNTHNVKRDINLCWNPNFEYDTNGYLVDSGSVTTIRRFKPSLEATPFDAYDGEYGLRRTFLTAAATTSIMYNHDGAEGIPVIAGYGYKFLVRGARYTTATDAQLRADIIWYDDNGAVISTITGTPVTMTNIRTWYAASHSGTAPATAVTAKLRVTFLRSGGTNFAIGAKLYADAFCFFEVTSLTDTMTYFSGDTEDTAGFLYSWFGQPGWSESARFVNDLPFVLDSLIDRFADTTRKATELRWNASEDFTAAASLDLFQQHDVVNSSVAGGLAQAAVIVGIQWEINPETIMCTLRLREFY
jgi:hypothetical protein